MFRAQAIAILLFSLISANSQVYTDILKLKLDSALSLINENEPGGTIYIEQSYQILYSKSFGMANVPNERKFSETTLSNIGGISKVFIAYSILILQEQGKLNIEDSLFKYIPDIKNKEFAQKIKIRHLLTHTSGLKDLPSSQMDSVFSLRMNDEQNFERVKYANTLAFEPGNNYSFSDQAFSALVLIIEKVSKISWQEFVKLYILKPSSMAYSKLTDDSDETEGVAHGYKLVNKSYVEYDQLECPKMFTASNAGVWCNIEDLRKFIYALKSCFFLKCESVKLSQQTLLPWNWYSPYPPPHTFCWFTNEPNVNNSNALIEYSGSIGGHRSQLLYFPEKDLMIIWLSNNGKDYSKTIFTQLNNLKFIK